MRIASRVAGFLIGVSLTLSSTAAAQTPETEMVVIEGAKNPELIPEHLMWSSAFHTIAFLKEQSAVDSGPLALLLSAISTSDAKLILTEAAEHKKRGAECDEKGRRIVRAIEAQGMEPLERAMKSNTLACRQALLDAVDRLLSRLSPEGRSELVRWVLDERGKITVRVPKADLAFFRQPR